MAIASTKSKVCPHGDRAIDCPVCLQLWADYMEDMRELDELAHAAALVRAATPCTDREWEEHLAACGYGEEVGR